MMYARGGATAVQSVEAYPDHSMMMRCRASFIPIAGRSWRVDLAQGHIMKFWGKISGF